MKELSFKESLEVPNSVYIDVRSPVEYGIDHVCGSVNIPLFENEERKEVGTIYRMAGREDAIMRGTEIVGVKLKDLVRSFMEYQDKNIVLLCARGGMRSGSLASLLDAMGLSVYKLRQGYRGYRHYVIEQLTSLELPAPLFVLQGLTGSGKTEIIRKFPYAVDLEEMAGHRSSVFGGIDMLQKTQKRFESLLVDRIRALRGAPYLVIEGESRKIGNLHIPDSLYELMKRSPVLCLSTTLERRIDIIYREYHACCNDDNIPAIVKSLRSKLGSKNVELLIGLYREKKIRQFIHVMLETYYDPLYRHTLDRKEYAAIIQNLDTDDSVKQIRDGIEEQVRKSASLLSLL